MNDKRTRTQSLPPSSLLPLLRPPRRGPSRRLLSLYCCYQAARSFPNPLLGSSSPSSSSFFPDVQERGGGQRNNRGIEGAGEREGNRQNSNKRPINENKRMDAHCCLCFSLASRVLSAKVCSQTRCQSGPNRLSNLGSVTCFFAATVRLVHVSYKVTFLTKVVEQHRLFHSVKFQPRPCSRIEVTGRGPRENPKWRVPRRVKKGPLGNPLGPIRPKLEFHAWAERSVNDTFAGYSTLCMIWHKFWRRCTSQYALQLCKG